MAFVLDASVALAWVMPDEASAKALSIRERLRTECAVVPNLWSLELTNAVLMARRRSRLSAKDVSEGLRLLSAVPVGVDNGTFSAAWEHTMALAAQHVLSVYDAAYLELAKRRSLPLATLDKALRKAARKEKVELL